MSNLEKTGSKASGAVRAPRDKTRAAGAAANTAKAGILVVDDHSVLREGLVRVIDQTADLFVCGTAGSISQALTLLEKAKPRLMVVDIALGEQNGLELVKDVQARQPGLPVLVYSMFDESLYAARCLRAGAKGYVMKQEPTSRMLDAIRQVLRGEVSLSETMTKQLLARLSTGHTSHAGAADEQLSDREFEVFELLGRGRSTKEIAQALHLSSKTVQTHREHIKEKLKIRDAAGLVRRAVQWVEGQF